MKRTAKAVACTAALAMAIVTVLVEPGVASGPVIRSAELGDSYSAGVGLGPVTQGCDRDTGAWGPRGMASLKYDYSVDHLSQFYACSGNTMVEVNSQQTPRVTTNTDVVTLSVGGNDIGFKNKLYGCTIGDCGPDVYSLSARTKAAPTQTWDEIYNRLVSTYSSIRQKMRPDGHLYVASYPIPFALNGTARCYQQVLKEQRAVNALVTRLDDTIYLAVQNVNQQRASRGLPGNVHFLDWRTGTRIRAGYTIPAGYAGAGAKFDTYESPDGLCNNLGRVPFIYGYKTPLGNSFHPTGTGYGYMASKLSKAVRVDFGSPFGAYDSASSPSDNRVQVAGWAEDPTSPSAQVTVRVTSGGALLGTGLANLGRQDVANVYPSYGPNHGFNFSVTAPAGNRSICVTAVNIGGGNDQPLGCKNVDVPGVANPLDYGPPGTVSINPCLDLHSQPGHTASVIGCVPNGTVIKVQCQVHSNYVSGPWGTTDLWDRTYWNGMTGFVTDAYVYTGTNGTVAPPC